MSQRGFTLTELMIVVTIMGILMSIGVLSYGRWSAKSAVERETQEMLADFSSCRIKAMQTKRPFRIVLNQLAYQIRSYGSLDDMAANLPGAGGVVAIDKALQFPIQRDDGTAFNNFSITLDATGAARDAAGNPFNQPAQLVITVVHAPNIVPAVDCVSIDNIQTKMGIFENGTCTPK